MKKLFFILIALFIANNAWAQFCLSEGITFSIQAQIDNFQTNYPGCTEIEGNVTISDNYSSNISNLNGLSVLTSIGGSLYIGQNSALTNLSGLDNVVYVASSVEIRYNPSLASLTGLGNLGTIGGALNLESNTALVSLSGLDGLTSIQGNFSLYENAITSMTGLESLSYAGRLGMANNDSLSTLDGLENLAAIGSDIIIAWNDALTSLAGLEGLITIGGGIDIHDNSVLTSLNGLGNLDASSITSLAIVNNYSLSTCAVESVCVYLDSLFGLIAVFNNATGCNSREEVAVACGLGLGENTDKMQFSILPNPVSYLFTITFTMEQPAQVNFKVISRLGQVMSVIFAENLPQGEHQVTWNTEGLPAGLYFYRLTAGNLSSTGKLVVVK